MTDDRNASGREIGAADCAAVRRILPSYARGDLESAREESLLAHAAACPACLAALAEVDPAALFLELRGRSLPEGFWEGFDRTLRERLTQERQQGWRWSRAWEALASALRPPRLAYVAAPLAMVFLLGVSLYVTRPGLFSTGPRAHRPERGQRSPYEQPVTPRHGVAGARPDGEAAATRPAASVPLSFEASPLEEVRSPAARVYRLDVAGQDPTPIYMVVDETIDF